MSDFVKVEARRYPSDPDPQVCVFSFFVFTSFVSYGTEPMLVMYPALRVLGLYSWVARPQLAMEENGSKGMFYLSKTFVPGSLLVPVVYKQVLLYTFLCIVPVP